MEENKETEKTKEVYRLNPETKEAQEFYSEIGKKNLALLEKLYPEAKVGAVQMEDRLAMLYFCKPECDFLEDFENENENDFHKMLTLFNWWFQNRKMGATQEILASISKMRREELSRYINKYEKLFEYIEMKLVQHAFSTKIFKFFNEDKESLKRMILKGEKFMKHHKNEDDDFS